VTRPRDAAGPPPVDDFASSVLDVVDSIPPGRVMSYGDIAEYLGAGPGPRQVGRVMAVYGGAVAWWRVIHADGTPAPGHDSVALRHYLAEGTPLRSARPPVRVDMHRARWPGLPRDPALPRHCDIVVVAAPARSADTQNLPGWAPKCQCRLLECQ
jgi:alkylated DNA nucleotide flippase Atl1